MGFVISPRPKCDIILSQEEYDMVMQHRAMKRLIASRQSREAPPLRALKDKPALQRLLELR
jgi:hypothetical protein